jgi:hypothetical protein
MRRFATDPQKDTSPGTHQYEIMAGLAFAKQPAT